jgi:hypothetical protein
LLLLPPELFEIFSGEQGCSFKELREEEPLRVEAFEEAS